VLRLVGDGPPVVGSVIERRGEIVLIRDDAGRPRIVPEPSILEVLEVREPF
jgi:hypothetical protein